jgi:hypothetical protein
MQENDSVSCLSQPELPNQQSRLPIAREQHKELLRACFPTFRDNGSVPLTSVQYPTQPIINMPSAANMLDTTVLTLLSCSFDSWKLVHLQCPD